MLAKASLLFAVIVFSGISGCLGARHSFEATAGEALIIQGGYSYDGRSVRKALDGQLTVRLNDEDNTGRVESTVQDVDGTTWRIVFDEFTGTPGPQGGGVHQSFFEHGDTGNGSTELPKFFAYVAAWGNGTVFRNDNVVRDPVTGDDGWTNMHLMISRGKVRDPDSFQILKADGTCCYDPANPSNGALATDVGAQAILQAKTRAGTFFLHFEFEEVSISRNRVPSAVSLI